MKLRLLGIALAAALASGSANADALDEVVAAVMKPGNDPDTIIAAYTRALTDPGLAPTDRLSLHAGRGGFYKGQGKLDAALADYAEVLAIDPADSVAHQGRAEVYLKRSRFGPALVEADALLANNDEWGYAHYLKAKALDGLGRDGEARAQYRKALDLKTISPEYADMARAVLAKP